VKPVISPQEFLRLSALINYQLSADPISWRAVLALITPTPRPRREETLLLDALDFLGQAYGQTKRRLGPVAVLHPIRSAALLELASGRASLLDLLTTLLHDKNEDLVEARYSRDTWRELERHYAQLVKALDDTDRWFLNERVEVLARQPGETYHRYLGRVLDRAAVTPEVVRVKLADRLDNTLDMRVDIEDETAHVDCFQMIFNILYSGPGAGAAREGESPHPIPGKMDGARRLFQLFKNAVFLSLLRQRRIDTIDEPTARLFHTLAGASLNESQRTLVHLFLHHVRDARVQRELLIDVMRYCESGAVNCLTRPGATHRLDGLFASRFDIESRVELDTALDGLYADKNLMVEVATAFAAIFSSFLADPAFLIRGIDAAGLRPSPPA